ncbi:probable serine/threonine-protein kinase PBL4 isoform X1 [Momordica charantia]|uniref:Probable serine/threonine-protein kinase PBL4 isoform X1 n=1 Tax=Momordica charantia TaxID=3673 RepID=A0A6J1CIR2_MOMCH|nr:probable serine/threonine-protein kinase PBL4 isoform X1 [Momordica charantia]XP_022141470.1 probable serine/threonine-protein kinase PBL4 isoform X1 [Momordica charantia]
MTCMETPLTSSRIIIAYDATKDRTEHELQITLRNLWMRGDILRGGDTLIVLGILHKVLHPMGYQLKACPDSIFGSGLRAMEEEVSKKVDAYIAMLQQSAEMCEDGGVSIEVRITAGFPIKHVIIQEIMVFNASWVILDRHLRRDESFYLRHLSCKVAVIYDNLSVRVLRNKVTTAVDKLEHKLFYSKSMSIPSSDSESLRDSEQTVLSIKSFSMQSSSQESSYAQSNCTSSSSSMSREALDPERSSQQEKVGTDSREQKIYATASQIVQCPNKDVFQQKHSEAPILCSVCGTRSELYMKDTMKFSYSDIQRATADFSAANLLGEGGYGHVFKGELKDGQLIAAKVRKEASAQGFVEFHSEIQVLSFARHKNIVMLLGYSSKENLNVLVYEYICNGSLDFHLFGKTNTVLELHQRYGIAIGIAKGLRFLHEECRGGPVIHRDVRPSNILLTHDFVPMLGDFGLAKWKTKDDTSHTRILGTFGYVAPEYAENGILSVRTDVYAFGIVLLQLISGRKVFDMKDDVQGQSLREWAEPLIENLALHELIDSRVGKTYDTYELYLMARTAYLCVQMSPENRPSMGEVVRLLEGENDHFHYLGEKLVPRYTK